MDIPNDDIKYVTCDSCGQTVPCNAAYPVEQITCFRCLMEKKWRKHDKNQP